MELGNIGPMPVALYPEHENLFDDFRAHLVAVESPLQRQIRRTKWAGWLEVAARRRNERLSYLRSKKAKNTAARIKIIETTVFHFNCSLNTK